MCPITGFALLSVQLKAAHDSGILSHYKENSSPFLQKSKTSSIENIFKTLD